MPAQPPRRLRSQLWFDDPSHADMTALYVERFMNYGLTREELQSGGPSSALRKRVTIWRRAIGTTLNWRSV